MDSGVITDTQNALSYCNSIIRVYCSESQSSAISTASGSWGGFDKSKGGGALWGNLRSHQVEGTPSE